MLPNNSSGISRIVQCEDQFFDGEKDVNPAARPYVTIARSDQNEYEKQALAEIRCCMTVAIQEICFDRGHVSSLGYSLKSLQ